MPLNGQDAIVAASVLDTIAEVLKRSVKRAVVVNADPLSPTPFTGSASGAIEAALANATQLSFTNEEIAAVKQAIDNATEYENRMQQTAGRAIQIMEYIKPLVGKLIPLII